MAERKPKWAWSSVDDPNPIYPKCERCDSFARWAVARFEDFDVDLSRTTTRWFACGKHLSRILDDEDWLLDVVAIYDITYPPERG